MTLDQKDERGLSTLTTQVAADNELIEPVTELLRYYHVPLYLLSPQPCTQCLYFVKSVRVSVCNSYTGKNREVILHEIGSAFHLLVPSVISHRYFMPVQYTMENSDSNALSK
jgi:hypothetical protein